MKIIVPFTLAVAFQCTADSTKVAHWTGAHSLNWNDTRNWAEGVVPGRRLERDANNEIVYRDAQGNVAANGTWCTIGEYGWTAVFDRADAPSRVDTGGEVKAISNVIIRSANNTTKFGASYAHDLPIEAGGGIYVEASATKVPVFEGRIGVANIAGSTTVTFQNDSAAGVMALNRLDLAYDVTDQSNVWKVKLMFGGAGTIRLKSNLPSNNYFRPHIVLAQSEGGRLIVDDTAFGNGRLTSIGSAPNCPTQHLEITSGSVLYAGNATAFQTFASDTEIFGDGTLNFPNTTLGNTPFEISADKRVRISCTFASPVGWCTTGAGTLEFAGANTTTGPGLVYDANSMAEAATMAQIGMGDELQLNPGAGFRYTGTGEETGKRLALLGSSAVPSSIENSGAGELVFAGCSGNSSRVLAVSGAIGFKTATPFNVSLMRGASIAYAGSGEMTASEISVQADAALRVGDGVVLTVSRFSAASGAVLDIALGESSSVRIAGFDTPGMALPGFRVNGGAARVDPNGFIVSQLADDMTVDVHGGVIPDAQTSVVGIVDSSVTGGLTLGSDLTRLSGLNQRATNSEAVVALGTGQSFAVQSICICDQARPLVFDGAGSLLGSFFLQGGDLVRSNGENTVTVASENGAMVSLEGTLTETAPLVSAFSSGKVDMAATGSVPIENIDISDGAVLTWQDGRFYQPGIDFQTSSPDPTAVDFKGMRIGQGSSGVLEFESGAYTGAVLVAGLRNNSYGKGAIYQRGGEIAASGEYLFFYGLDYLELSGGRYSVAGDIDLGAYGQFGMTVTGGTFRIESGAYRNARLYFGGYNCDASLFVGRGGVFDASGIAYNGSYMSVSAPARGARNTYRTQWTVENGGLIDLGLQQVCTSPDSNKGSATHTESVFNLNEGGILRLGNLFRDIGSLYPTADDPDGRAADPNLTNHLSLVQFNGGTLECTRDSYPFCNRVGSMYAPNRITVFEKGATLDVANGECALRKGGELLAPYGKGVEAVALGAASNLTFIGPPAVRIEGDGAGASALALFDKSTGRLTGIQVTGRGNGYTAATAALYYGDYSVPIATLGEVTLSDNVSGGFVKKGASTLIIAATNTYTGATTLKEGTVMLAVDDGIDARSELVLDGGTLDLNGHRQSFSDLTVKSGTVVNGGITLTSLTVDFDDVLAGSVKTIDMSCVTDYAQGTEVVLQGYDLAKIPDGVESLVLVRFTNGLPATLPTLPDIELRAGWRFAYVGERLKMGKVRGLCIGFK